MRFASKTLCLLLPALLACSHDLAALKSAEKGTGGAHDSGVIGGTGDDASVGGTGAASGSGGTGGGGGTGGSGATDACKPCDDLTDAAKALKLEVCCRGYLGGDCGLRSPFTKECLPMMVPGVAANEQCSPLMSGSVRLDACCRPDGRCGVDSTDSGLGCVETSQLMTSSSGADAETCPNTFPCTQDKDCAIVEGDNMCIAQKSGGATYCVDQCRGDKDCAKGQVCGLSQDFHGDRVLSTCMRRMGSAKPGEACAVSSDCERGLCIMNKQVCTLICGTDADCPKQAPKCAETMVPTPQITNPPAKFKICS